MAEKGPWGSPEGAVKRDKQVNIVQGIRSQLKALSGDVEYEVDEDMTREPSLIITSSNPSDWQTVQKRLRELVSHADGLARQSNAGSIEIDDSKDGEIRIRARD